MAKKSFKDNPALAFISNPEEEPEVQNETEESPSKGIRIRSTANKAPEGYKRNPEYIETKSKRVQLLLQPSTVDAMKELARKRGLSFNEACNEAIHEYLHNEYVD